MRYPFPGCFPRANVAVQCLFVSVRLGGVIAPKAARAVHRAPVLTNDGTQRVGHGDSYAKVVCCMRLGDGVCGHSWVDLPKRWCDEVSIKASSFVVCEEGIGV